MYLDDTTREQLISIFGGATEIPAGHLDKGRILEQLPHRIKAVADLAGSRFDRSGSLSALKPYLAILRANTSSTPLTR